MHRQHTLGVNCALLVCLRYKLNMLPKLRLKHLSNFLGSIGPKIFAVMHRVVKEVFSLGAAIMFVRFLNLKSEIMF